MLRLQYFLSEDVKKKNSFKHAKYDFIKVNSECVKWKCQDNHQLHTSVLESFLKPKEVSVCYNDFRAAQLTCLLNNTPS